MQSDDMRMNKMAAKLYKIRILELGMIVQKLTAKMHINCKMIN